MVDSFRTCLSRLRNQVIPKAVAVKLRIAALEAAAGNPQVGMKVVVENLLAAYAVADPLQIQRLSPTLPAVDEKEQTLQEFP